MEEKRRRDSQRKDIRMEDDQIVGLFWKRSEEAIHQTRLKYGQYCHVIAYHILYSSEDAEECVNDTYMRAWNSMPPNRPARLKSFLGKITRGLSLDRYRKQHARKRGMGVIPLVLEELQECIPAGNAGGDFTDDLALIELLNAFLAMLPPETRKIFLRRYWYMDSIREISNGYGMSESKVKMRLLRTRKLLKEFLEKEGVRV